MCGKPVGYEDQGLLSIDTGGQGVAVMGLVSKMRSIVEGLLGVLLTIGERPDEGEVEGKRGMAKAWLEESGF
jgi:hypothetical protein